MEATDLGKRYRRRWALRQCTVSVPDGHIVGIVGPNGAGKSTLLHLAAGLLTSTSGTIDVLGGAPARDATALGRVGFMAQDPPVFSSLSIHDHLPFGARLNPSWDASVAERRIDDPGLDPSQRAGKLSGGQRAQLALTLSIAKRPQLLLLDEPVASLDPLARREFLQILMETAAETQVSIVLSSYLVSDIERVCDYLIGGVTFDGVGRCPNTFPSLRPVGGNGKLNAAMQRCTGSFHLHTTVTYQPESRYWSIQWIEAAIFVIGAVALMALSLWWVRKRLVRSHGCAVTPRDSPTGAAPS